MRASTLVETSRRVDARKIPGGGSCGCSRPTVADESAGVMRATTAFFFHPLVEGRGMTLVMAIMEQVVLFALFLATFMAAFHASLRWEERKRNRRPGREVIGGSAAVITSTEPNGDVPDCPKCGTPMRLTRAMPSITQNGAENQIFACQKCGITSRV
jgi:hypothetical protein